MTTTPNRSRSHIVLEILPGALRGRVRCGRRVWVLPGEGPGIVTGKGGPCRRCWASWRAEHPDEKPQRLPRSTPREASWPR